MNKQGNDKQTIIEDLPVDEVRQDEVKGGESTPIHQPLVGYHFFVEIQ